MDPEVSIFIQYQEEIGRGIVTTLCAYEIVALWVDKPWLPPISRVLYQASNHRFARFAAWAIVGYAADHFFGD